MGNGQSKSVDPADPVGLVTLTFEADASSTDGASALIVAGVHGSELGGIEIAKWVCVILSARAAEGKFPRYKTTVVPELFPGNARRVRMVLQREPEADGDLLKAVGRFRETPGSKSTHWIETNRQCPPPGRSLSDLERASWEMIDPSGNALELKSEPKTGTSLSRAHIPLVREWAQLIELIEFEEPVRIASLHGRIVEGDAGVFVDPRYRFDKSAWEKLPEKDRWMGAIESYKFDTSADPGYVSDAKKQRWQTARDSKGNSEDDPLDLALAKASAAAGAQVGGNHLGPMPQVHYTKSNSSEVVVGFSLGDWGPVDSANGKRRGAPVFTFEPGGYRDSGAFVSDLLIATNEDSPKVLSSPYPFPSRKDLKEDTSDRRSNGGKAKTLASLPKFEDILKKLGPEKPWSFSPARARELRAFATALVDVFLECPR